MSNKYNAAGPVDQFGNYQDTDDGTWYLSDGTPLYWYEPTTGNYQEEGDNTIYDANGNPIGNADNSGADTPAAASSGGSFWNTALNSAGNFLGGYFKTAGPTPTVAAPVPVVQANNTGAIVISVVVVLVLVGGVVYFVHKK